MSSDMIQFSSPIDEAAISRLKRKLPLADKRPAADKSAMGKLNSDIGDALWVWRDRLCKSDLSTLLKISGDIEFTNAELDLAGWVRTYAEFAKISLSTAIDRIFEYLKSCPQSLENYTNGNADFAESEVGMSSLNMPFGWACDPASIETFRRARVYQAINQTCDLVGAVIEIQKGDEVMRAKIQALETENAQLRDGLSGK